MTEREWWAKHIRKALNHPPHEICRKQEDRYLNGVPDCAYAFRGVQGVFEIKLEKAWPEPGGLITPRWRREQRPRLREWALASDGQALFLLGIKDKWFALPWWMPRAFTPSQLDKATLATGPLRELSVLRQLLLRPLPRAHLP